MARVRSPNRDKAFEIYKEHNGEITNREIANILDTPEKTISGWKVKDKWKDKWKDKLNGVLRKKIRSTPNKNSSKKVNTKANKKVIANEVKELMENEELNDKQRLFCVIYSRCLNATKAYQKAYHSTYETAMVNGPRLLGNASIRQQVNKLNAIEFNKEYIKKSILQKYIDIAFSDITEYLKFGQRDEPVIDKDGNPVLDENGFIKTESYSYVELGESDQVDGTLINEIAQGKGGIKIKLADKMKALDVLNRYSNLLSDEEKTALELENKKLTNRKLSAELNKINGIDDNKTHGNMDKLLEVFNKGPVIE